MKVHRTKPHLLVRVLNPAVNLAFERSNVRAVPVDGLPAHRAQPDDRRVFGHGDTTAATLVTTSDER